MMMMRNRSTHGHGLLLLFWLLLVRKEEGGSSGIGVVSVHGELLDYNQLIIDPSPETVHYSQFYVRGPGSIDLRRVSFTAVGGGGTSKYNNNNNNNNNKNAADEEQDDWDEDNADDFDDDDDDQSDDQSNNEEDGAKENALSGDEDNDDVLGDGADDETVAGGGITGEGDDEGNDDAIGTGADDETNIGGGDRILQRQSQGLEVFPTSSLSSRHLISSTAIDIVTFHIPATCAHSLNGCDWTKLGVGAKHDDGTLRWCCTAEAQKLGLCVSGPSQLGRLIINTQILPGEHRVVQVPDGGTATVVDRPKIKVNESGEYILLMASCSDGGRQVVISGTAAIRSVHGYLPGDLYGFLFFFAVLTILYFILVLAYGFAMHLNEDSRIPIEKWILATIVLGLLEMTFKLGDVFVWNEDGHQVQWISLIGALFGVMKQGYSRSLLVMVSLGWGVTRDSLGRKLKWIVMAGITYVCVTAARDTSLVFAVENVRALSQSMERGLFDVYMILTFFVAALDALFSMWILDSLSATMEYLEGMKQMRKLTRYIRLRCLFLCAILFALVWVIFSIVNSVTTGLVEEEDAWLVNAATEINYFAVLVGIAFLWRPNSSAREYAYAMELPTMQDDDDDDDDEYGGSELELTDSVPSALDSYDDGDENEGKIGNGRSNDEAFQDAITPPGPQNSRNRGYKDY